MQSKHLLHSLKDVFYDFFRFVVVLLLISGSLISQNNPSREILNDLCSDEMMGRGYVRFGHVKAAKYIQEYYKSIQLNNLKGNIFAAL